jgi:hypothetical protein
VPWTTVPFFSSIVTVSLLSFIKNLLSKRVSYDKMCKRDESFESAVLEAGICDHRLSVKIEGSLMCGDR